LGSLFEVGADGSSQCDRPRTRVNIPFVQEKDTTRYPFGTLFSTCCRAVTKSPVTLHLVYPVTRARYCAPRTCAPSCRLPRCRVAAGYLRPDRSETRTRSSEHTSSGATRLLAGCPPHSRYTPGQPRCHRHPAWRWLRYGYPHWPVPNRAADLPNVVWSLTIMELKPVVVGSGPVQPGLLDQGPIARLATRHAPSSEIEGALARRERQTNQSGSQQLKKFRL